MGTQSRCQANHESRGGITESLIEELPRCVMLSYDSYESMLAGLEDLEDRLAVHEAREEGPDLRVEWEKLKAESGSLTGSHQLARLPP